MYCHGYFIQHFLYCVRSPNHVTTEMREGLAKSMLIKWPTLYHHDIPACADESLFPWVNISSGAPLEFYFNFVRNVFLSFEESHLQCKV